MRIVGYREVAVLLGFGLAIGAIGSAGAQTVVGGDGRPAVEVDHSVLDNLGPTPTLPDLLLGRRPAAPASSAVKLHKPTGKAIAGAKTPKLTKPKAIADAAPKLKEPKARKPADTAVAKTEPKGKSAPTEKKTADTAKTSQANKKLASNFEPPPKPPTRPSAAMSNADMPGATIEPTKPTPAEAKAAETKTASKPSTTTNAPQKLAAAEPPATAKTDAPKPPESVKEPAKAEAPKAPEPPKAETAKTEAPKADAAKTESKVALMTPPPTTAATSDGAALTIPFPKEGATLSDDARGALVNVAKRALGDNAIQLQVLAYASGDEDSASKARRLSLSRALAVRSFLIDQGVHSTRIEVRALGNKVPDGPPDRVDLVEQKH